MEKTFKITINLLTEKVKENLTKIQKNQKQIRDLLALRDTEARNEKLKKKCQTNKCLLEENIDLINMQLNLTSLLEREEKGTFPGRVNELNPILREVNDCFELTIPGVLIYNTDCMCFSDDRFGDFLANYYQQLDSYKKTVTIC